MPLEPGGGWLPDGSRLTWLNAPSGKKQDRLAVRAAEHNVILPFSEAWAWLAGTQLVRASAAAALRSEAAAARALRRRNHALVTTDEGILHRHLAPLSPLHDNCPGHRVIVTGSDRRRRGRRRPRRPAHPQHPRPAPPLQTRPESLTEIPARHRHQDNRHRETPAHRIRTRPPLARCQDRKPSPPAGNADRGTAGQARRVTRAAAMPGHRQRNPENRH